MSDVQIIERAVGTQVIKEQIKPEIDVKYHLLNTDTRLGLEGRKPSSHANSLTQNA